MSAAEDRERIHAALEKCEITASTEGLLVAWVVIAEWVTPDGERWLSRRTLDELSPWQRDGMLWHGLEGDWDGDDPDEEDG